MKLIDDDRWDDISGYRMALPGFYKKQQASSGAKKGAQGMILQGACLPNVVYTAEHTHRLRVWGDPYPNTKIDMGFMCDSEGTEDGNIHADLTFLCHQDCITVILLDWHAICALEVILCSLGCQVPV